MDFLELVKKRSSVREYDSRPVKREEIESCIEAARLAPSACNLQPWRFIIADTPDARNRLCAAMTSGIYGMNSFVKSAPALAVVTDRAAWPVTIGNAVRDTKLHLIDIGIACEHFILRAAELGIGTCWLGWFSEKAVKKLLALPKAERVHVIISMGYPCRCSREQGALHAEDSTEGYPPAGFQSLEKVRKPVSEIRTYAE